MMLEELIKRLEQEDSNKIVSLGFDNPHSYRGYYSDLAFTPAKNMTVGKMLECAKWALGSTYTGYKGGDFTMNKYTEVWLAHYGDCGESIGHVLLDYMFNLVEENKEKRLLNSWQIHKLKSQGKSI